MVTRKTAKAIAQDDVEDVLDNLYEIYGKLDRLNPAQMSKEDNEKWTDEYTAVTAAIRVLENESLESINESLGADAKRIATAIDEAESALHGLQDDAAILGVVGNVLKSIAAIASIVV